MMNLRADSFVFILSDESDERQFLCDSCQETGLQVLSFSSSEELLAALEMDRPGCVVMNLYHRQQPAHDLLRAIGKQAPPRPVIILADQPTLAETIEAFRTGATDVFVQPLSPELLVQRIRAAIASDIPRRRHYLHWLEVRDKLARLTPPEADVVKLLTEGLLNKQIAARLNVAVRTIELRRANIFRKMEVASLGDLLRLVIFWEIYSEGSPGD